MAWLAGFAVRGVEFQVGVVHWSEGRGVFVDVFGGVGLVDPLEGVHEPICF